MKFGSCIDEYECQFLEVVNFKISFHWTFNKSPTGLTDITKSPQALAFQWVDITKSLPV